MSDAFLSATVTIAGSGGTEIEAYSALVQDAEPGRGRADHQAAVRPAARPGRPAARPVRRGRLVPVARAGGGARATADRVRQDLRLPQLPGGRPRLLRRGAPLLPPRVGQGRLGAD